MKSWILIMFVALSVLPSLLQPLFKQLKKKMDEVVDDDKEVASFDEQPAPVYEQREYQFEAANEASHSKSVLNNVVDTAEDSTPSPVFDLRQAIVYQTLLENKYIGLEK